MSFLVIKSAMDLGQLGEQELEELYTWVDSIPLSRPKRNITRDFSDGVMVAEVISNFLPKLIEIHNYSPANATPQKMQNWFLLNRKVFKKLRFELSEDVLRGISNCKPGVIEGVLAMLRTRMERVVWETQQKVDRQAAENERPEADQNSFRLLHHISVGEGVKQENASAAGHQRERSSSTANVKISQDVSTKVNIESSRGLAALKPRQRQIDHISIVHGAESLKNEGQESGDKHVGEVPIVTSNDEEKQDSGSQRKDVTSLNGGPYRGMNPQTKSKSNQVPLLLLEEKEQEILAKDETIQILNAKIKRMEHLLHLKDIRIEDLQARLEVSRPTGKSWESGLETRGPKDKQLSQRLKHWLNN